MEPKEHDIRDVNLNDLIPFQLHPVATKDGEQLQRLMNSIECEGLKTPITVRRLADVKYEIIYGHNRVKAMRALGHDIIQAIVIEGMTDDDARELFYRTYLTPQAFWSWTYLPRFRAIQYIETQLKKNSHQGRCNDLIEKIHNVTRDDQELHTRRPTSRDNAAASIGISTATFSRYRSVVKLEDKSVILMARLLDDKLLTYLEEHPDQRIDMDKLKEYCAKEGRTASRVQLFMFPDTMVDVDHLEHLGTSNIIRIPWIHYDHLQPRSHFSMVMLSL